MPVLYEWKRTSSRAAEICDELLIPQTRSEPHETGRPEAGPREARGKALEGTLRFM